MHFDKAALKVSVNSLQLPVKTSLESIWIAVDPAAKEFRDTLEAIVSRIASLTEGAEILKSEDLTLGKLGTEKISLLLKPSVAVPKYEMKDGRIQELLFNYFRKRISLFTRLKRTRFLKLVFDNSQ